jgi:hypothetical protein
VTAARVGPLLVHRSRWRPRRVTVAAGLTSPRVAITVVGPRYAAEAPLATRRGVASATLQLPKRRRRYRIAIADLGATPMPRAAVAEIRLPR